MDTSILDAFRIHNNIVGMIRTERTPKESAGPKSDEWSTISTKISPYAEFQEKKETTVCSNPNSS
ncbi:hypothetical protein ZHAS_00011016 [Anopheles sinensis]|uniref:Uncharacterized protein n=1 Tax=Anopheles sinensis TaxID=74873 RepID=A0A084VZ44_ANOSI|nr:hypothetical protein ZHAS_00011016 [Anopheles sinensis]